MSDPKMIILYVENAETSAAFYAQLLGKAPAEASPGFAMFPLDGGMMLGLWRRNGVLPAASLTGGGGELAFMMADRQGVLDTHAAWAKQGIVIAQAPEIMDFGFTFTALDPDNHRLRVFTPGDMAA
ncbi:MAG: extradiol dioxygenase [Rhizobiales bacterium PAR1]|nr:MAG: extradiol dioxygenase [Rhizobiales bacterium PAR1]